jgi:hypothetical protein
MSTRMEKRREEGSPVTCGLLYIFTNYFLFHLILMMWKVFIGCAQQWGVECVPR